MNPVVTALQRQLDEIKAAIADCQEVCPHPAQEVQETRFMPLKRGDKPSRGMHCQWCDKRWTEYGWTFTP